MATERLRKAGHVEGLGLVPRSRQGPDDPIDFVQWATPRYLRPYHLGPIATELRRAWRESIELVVSVPPRFSKTDTLLHWIVQTLLRWPEKSFAYISHAARFADSRCRRARKLAQRVGLPLGEKVTENYWETAAGGSMQSAGVGKPLTGEGFDFIVVDDPIRNRQQAESFTQRESVYQGLVDDVFTRVVIAGTSIIVNHTRWHEDDPAGRLIRAGWRHINLPAILDDGTSLWPEAWPVERLERMKAKRDAYSWESLYQGRPRPRGTRLFGPPTYCDQLPRYDYSAAIGLDLAYSEKTHADHSVSLVLGVEGRGDARRWYVMDVQRRQVLAPEFKAVVRAHTEAYPGAPMRWYCYGPEKGVADFFAVDGLDIEAISATGDKYVRAQAVSEAWNAGRIMVPRNRSWTKDFVDEVCGFTGLDDPEDDQVDALAAAYDQIADGTRGYEEMVEEMGGQIPGFAFPGDPQDGVALDIEGGIWTAAWSDADDGSQLRFSKSFDGLSWDTPTNISTGHSIQVPAIATTGSNHVVAYSWGYGRGGADPAWAGSGRAMYVRRFPVNNGWSSAVFVGYSTSGPALAHYSGGTFILAYVTTDSSCPDCLRTKVSTDYGATWSSEYTDDVRSTDRPAIAWGSDLAYGGVLWTTNVKDDGTRAANHIRHGRLANILGFVGVDPGPVELSLKTTSNFPALAVSDNLAPQPNRYVRITRSLAEGPPGGGRQITSGYIDDLTTNGWTNWCCSGDSRSPPTAAYSWVWDEYWTLFDQ